MCRILIMLIIWGLSTKVAPAQEVTPALQVFESLIGYTWKAEGSWGDGSQFVQEQVYEWGLNQKLVKVRTYGNTRQDGFAFGLRNEGLRAWDASSGELRFWEFDVFGGITKGTVLVESKNIYYQYVYGSDANQMTLTDAWLYQNDSTYTFKVGVFEEGQWKQVYLETQMQRVAP